MNIPRRDGRWHHKLDWFASGRWLLRASPLPLLPPPMAQASTFGSLVSLGRVHSGQQRSSMPMQSLRDQEMSRSRLKATVRGNEGLSLFCAPTSQARFDHDDVRPMTTIDDDGHSLKRGGPEHTRDPALQESHGTHHHRNRRRIWRRKGTLVHSGARRQPILFCCHQATIVVTETLRSPPGPP